MTTRSGGGVDNDNQLTSDALELETMNASDLELMILARRLVKQKLIVRLGQLDRLL